MVQISKIFFLLLLHRSMAISRTGKGKRMCCSPRGKTASFLFSLFSFSCTVARGLRVRSLRLDFFPLENFSAGNFFFPLEIFPSGSTFLPLKNAFFDTEGQQRFIIFLITGAVNGYPDIDPLFLTNNLRISNFSIP